MLSHGSAYKTIGDSLLARMAKQLKLTRAELLALVDCSIDAEGTSARCSTAASTCGPDTAQSYIRSTSVAASSTR